MMKAAGAFCLLLFFLSLCHAGFAFGTDEAVGKKIVKLVNMARSKGAQCGGRYYKPVRPLRWDETLGDVSMKHCKYMAWKGQSGHTGADGSSPGGRITRAGYKWIACGENVGEGYLIPEEMVKAWLKSKGHCENIMNPDFREAGAFSVREGNRVYWNLVLATPDAPTRINP